MPQPEPRQDKGKGLVLAFTAVRPMAMASDSTRTEPVPPLALTPAAAALKPARPGANPPAAPRPLPAETGGPKGPEPTRYGDWERKGRCSDF